MKACAKCERMNPAEALFCQQCGTPFQTAADPLPVEEEEAWRTFIGPSRAVFFSLRKGWSWERSDDRYLEIFRKFGSGKTPRFAWTWNWSAFIFPPFLWFLYRKMYLYAAVYFIGPAIAFFLTLNPGAGSVWNIVAAGTANYLYYWHIKEQLAQLRARPQLSPEQRAALLRDLGGVQPYVIWLGVILNILGAALLWWMVNNGLPDREQGTGTRAAPRVESRTL